MSEHPAVLHNRIEKARRIADILRPNFSAATVSEFDEHQWSIVADLTGENLPSVETRILVVHELSMRRWSNPADPFEGINGD